MEIIIGSAPPLGSLIGKQQPKESGVVEAKLLHVRPPRKGISGPSGMERREKKANDPLRGRVLTLLVPDADSLPNDIDDPGKYRVVLRFSRK